MRFDDKVVIVTGAAQGIGRAIATAFFEAGAQVALVDLNIDKVRATADELGDGRPNRTIAVSCDVTRAADAERMAAEVTETLGRIDVLVNNAGVGSRHVITELPESDWDLIMDVNAKGTFLCTQAVLRRMLDQGDGAIVNIASQAGKMGFKYSAHYCAAKAAVLGFSRAVALDVAPTVRINSICPGMVNTELLVGQFGVEASLTGESAEEVRQRFLKDIPMGHLQDPDDIARAVLFLASDDAREITGESVNVTGGMLID